MIGRRRWMGGTASALGAWGARAVRARAESGFAGLPDTFARIEATRGGGGRLGLAVLDVGSGRQAGYRQHERFPLASTYKLLAAGAVLARADAGQDSLRRRVRFTRADLVTYSPVTETQAGGAGMTLAVLCAAAVEVSDNTAGNLLLRVLDGPAGLTAYLRILGDGA